MNGVLAQYNIYRVSYNRIKRYSNFDADNDCKTVQNKNTPNRISTYRKMRCIFLRTRERLNNQRAIEPDAERCPALAIQKMKERIDAYG